MVLCYSVCVRVCYRAHSANRQKSFIRASGGAGPDGVPAAQVLHPAVSIQRDTQTPATPPSPPPAADSHTVSINWEI